MRIASAALLLATVLSAQTSHPSFWRYMHPESKLLFGADVRNVTGSSLWRTVRTELEQSGVQIKETTQTKGVDLLADVDRVLISSPGPKPGRRPTRAGDAPVVIALSGRFNLAAIRKEFLGKGARKSAYKGIELLSPDRRQTDMHAALASPKVLLLGDIASLRAAIDNQPIADDAEAGGLLGRARELAEVHDIWFVSEVPPDALQPGAASGFGMKALRGFEGGLSFQSGFGVELALSTDSEQSAQQMGDMFKAFSQMAAAGQDASTQELLKRLRIGVTGTQITASLRYSEAEVRQGIGLARAKLAGGVGPTRKGAVLTAPVASAKAKERAVPVEAAAQTQATVRHPEPIPAEPEPKPLVVKIYNAGEGTAPRQHPLVRE